MGVLFEAARQATPHNCTTCLHEERCNGSKTNVWCPNWAERTDTYRKRPRNNEKERNACD